MRKFLMAIAGASILILGACGGGNDTAKEEDTQEETPAQEEQQQETEQEQPADEEQGAEEEGNAGGETTYDAAAAEALYQQSCATCHGATFDNQPNIDPINTYDAETIKQTALNGSANGKMPPILAGKEAEAENLAQWLSQQ